MNRSPVLDAVSKETTMELSNLQFLFLIPVGLSLAFMLWVLWSLTKELAHQNSSIDKQPMISIRVGDRYSLGEQLQRIQRPGTTLPLIRVSDYGARYDYGTARNTRRFLVRLPSISE